MTSTRKAQDDLDIDWLVPLGTMMLKLERYRRIEVVSNKHFLASKGRPT